MTLLCNSHIFNNTKTKTAITKNPTCGKKYSYQSDLSKHVKNDHNNIDNGTITCSICDYR